MGVGNVSIPRPPNLLLSKEIFSVIFSRWTTPRLFLMPSITPKDGKIPTGSDFLELIGIPLPVSGIMGAPLKLITGLSTAITNNVQQIMQTSSFMYQMGTGCVRYAVRSNQVRLYRNLSHFFGEAQQFLSRMNELSLEAKGYVCGLVLITSLVFTGMRMINYVAWWDHRYQKRTETPSLTLSTNSDTNEESQ